jgi:lipopolysaccharide/colanic/teichoic acid biosynthesis glycosyltransferase
MLKRLLDFSLIIFFSPILILIFLLVSSLIYLFEGRPILFKQKRIGKNCRKFTIYKFRTMIPSTTDKDISDQEKITKIGKFLRLTSLDEVPSILNVLIGDMSLVGPRPLLPEYLNYYSDYQNRRHEVKPGITGYAQINGRNKLKWSDRFKLDVYYVENNNIFFDIKILFLTLFKLFRIKDNQHDKKTTMYKFYGNEDD